MSTENKTPSKHEPRSFPQHHPSRMDSFDLERELEALDAIPKEQLSEYAEVRADFIREELKWRASRLITKREQDLIANSYKKLIESENARLITERNAAITKGVSDYKAELERRTQTEMNITVICNRQNEELSALRAEVERLTKERDEARQRESDMAEYSDKLHASNSTLTEKLRTKNTKTVSESIYSGKSCVVALAEVQHCDKLKRGPYTGESGVQPNGMYVITSKTRYDLATDQWANPIYIPEDEAATFLAAWCSYRHELESETLATLP